MKHELNDAMIRRIAECMAGNYNIPAVSAALAAMKKEDLTRPRTRLPDLIRRLHTLKYTHQAIHLGADCARRYRDFYENTHTMMGAFDSLRRDIDFNYNTEPEE